MLLLRMNKLYVCLISYFVYILVGGEGTCSNRGNVTSWSEWTCNIENSTATRTGTCEDNEHVSETVKVTVYSWTSWSPWSPTCGAAEVHRSRSCVVPSPDSVYCSTCGYENTTSLQSKFSNLPPCCDSEEYHFGPWTSWHPPCPPDDNGGKYINQSRTRERNCSDSSICTSCSIDIQTRRVILQSWSKWGEWSGTLRPCSEKIYRRRSRSCPAPTNPQDCPVYSYCNNTSDDVEYSCCGSVYTLRNISCGSEYCSWECYNKTSPISPNAPSPLIKDPFVCLADPPQCSELRRIWSVSSTSTSSPGSTARLPPKSQIPLTSSPTPTTSTTSSATSATATTSSATSTTSSPTSTTSSATSTTISPTSATSTTSSPAAYMWPLVAVSVTAIVVSAIMVVMVIVIVLHYKTKNRSNSYHLIPQRQSGDTSECGDQRGDIPSCPPPPYSVQSGDYHDDGNSVINNETIFSDLNADVDNSRERERVLHSDLEERRDCSRNKFYSTGKDQITETPFGSSQS